MGYINNSTELYRKKFYEKNSQIYGDNRKNDDSINYNNNHKNNGFDDNHFNNNENNDNNITKDDNNINIDNKNNVINKNFDDEKNMNNDNNTDIISISLFETLFSGTGWLVRNGMIVYTYIHVYTCKYITTPHAYIYI
jgi:hypothetical protein